MGFAVRNTTHSSLGVISLQILAADEKGNSWTDYKSQAAELSEPAGGKGDSESLLCRSHRDQTFLQDPPAEVEDTAEISAQAYCETSKST